MKLLGSTVRRLASLQLFLLLGSPFSLSATYQVLYSFTGGVDGGGLYSSVTLDKGNLYGVAQGDGPNGYGTVFKLTPGHNGKWAMKVLYGFGKGGNGSLPMGGVVLDSFLDIYGATWQGGAHNAGAVYRLTPNPWNEDVLYSFGDNPDDGGSPVGGVVMDSTGNLYGTTSRGGPTAAGERSIS